jgi:hypothetical protein
MSEGNKMKEENTINRKYLWSKCQEIEKKALKKTNVIICDSGHKALQVLNQRFKKKKYSKPKKYSLEEIPLAVTELNKKDFLDELIQFLKNDENDPEVQVSILRAQQIAGAQVEIPSELMNSVKAKKTDKITKLWNELENLKEIEVCELHALDDNYIAFKIRTPIGGYLSEAKAKDILALAKRDIAAANQAKCPNCSQSIDLMKRDNWGILGCPCGAVLGSIITNLSNLIIEKINNYGIKGFYNALVNFDLLFHKDEGIDLNCFDFYTFEKYLKSINFPNIEGPDLSNPHKTITVSTYIDIEGDDEIILPTCRMCVFSLEIYSYSGSNYLCAYPLKKDQCLELNDFHQEQEYINYEIISASFFWNKLLSAFSDYFIDIDRQKCNLEAKSILLNDFHGPICPNFSIDTDNFLLEENYGPMKVTGTDALIFGLENFERKAQENELKKINRFRQDFPKKINQIKKNEKLKNIIDARVEAGKEYQEPKKQLAILLAQHFDGDQLRYLKNWDGLKRYINCSNKALVQVISMAINFQKNKME